MVRVECYTIVFDLLDLCHETVVLVVHEGDDCTFINMVGVEFAVHGEGFTGHLVDASGFVVSERLGGLEDEVEGRAFFEGQQVLFESIEGYAKACDKVEGVVRASLFLQRFFSVLLRVQFVLYGQEFVLIICHIALYLIIYIIVLGTKVRLLVEITKFRRGYLLGGAPPDSCYVLFSGAEKRTKRDIHPSKSPPIWGDLTENHGRPMIFRVLASFQ